jgi:spore coat protein H
MQPKLPAFSGENGHQLGRCYPKYMAVSGGRLVLLGTLLVVACAETEVVSRPLILADAGTPSQPSEPLPAEETPARCPEKSHVAGTPGCLTAEAFDATRLRSFELTVRPADLASLPMLAKDPETESTYVPAQLSVDGEDVGMVGLRFKGAYGTLQGCIDDDLQLSCDKMSYKVKFDEFDQDKRWKALKKVNLHSMHADDTLMHEHLAYGLYRDMGVAAPRATHVRVSINGEPPQLFALTEAPDGRFTADRFAPAGDGNLYKEIWPVSSEPSYYQADLETNKDEPQDHAAFIEFAEALMQADRASLPAVLARFVDVDYLLNYMAVDRVLSNWDGVTSFYCGSSDPERGCGNHNMYWYVDEAGERFWLVPWDLDNTWALQTEHELIMPHWNQTPADCDQRIAWNGNWLMPPGCDPLFRGLAGAGQAAYSDAISAMLSGPFQVAKLQAEVDRIAALIEPAVAADSTLDLTHWRANVASLRSDIALLREKAELMRDGKDYSPLGLRLDARNDFEDAANVTFAMGSSLDPNPSSTASRALNRKQPLAGSADVRVDFDYHTGDTAWTWLNFGMRMHDGTADLGRVRRLQVTLKADQERDVRIELDSRAYANPYDGVRYGWDVAVGTAPTTVSLELTALVPRAGETLADDPRAIIAAVRELIFQVNAHGLDSDGFFPPGGGDPGFLQIDDIEFVSN